MLKSSQRGFTLIELSIVLVIIGLIVGGVLVGQSLVAASYVRAQITQIEKYNAAVNTFRTKYGALPGDLTAQAATQFGFAARGMYAGQGDGNGAIEGNDLNIPGYNFGVREAAGETVMFWVDLSAARLIEGGFSTGSATAPAVNVTNSSTPAISAYFPAAQLGGGNYVYVYSTGSGNGNPYSWQSTDINYFGVSAVTNLSVGIAEGGGDITSTPGMSVQQAYSIDKKIDDALPQSGRVLALYLNSGGDFNAVLNWANGESDPDPYGNPNSAVSGSATTCYDNANNVNNPMEYSTAQSNGNQMNCALSFQFQ